MQNDQEGKAETEHGNRNEEVTVGQDGSGLVVIRHGLLSVLAAIGFGCYFNVLMSITKRYFTSCLSIRSKASLIFWTGMTSTSAVMLFLPQ